MVGNGQLMWLVDQGVVGLCFVYVWLVRKVDCSGSCTLVDVTVVLVQRGLVGVGLVRFGRLLW